MPASENVAPAINYNAAIPIQATESPLQNPVVSVAHAVVPKPARVRGTRRKPIIPQPPQAIGFTHSVPSDLTGPPVASPGPHFPQQLNFDQQAVASPDPNYQQQLNSGPASEASPDSNFQQQLNFGPQCVAKASPNSQRQLNFGPPPVNTQDPQFQLNFGPPPVALDAGFPLLAPHQWLCPDLPAMTPPQAVAPDAEHEAVPRQQTMVPAMHFFLELPRPHSGAIMPSRNMGQPPVWAHKRQQLCEVLPYYNAYQSGVYMSAGIIHSMMIDGESRPQDIFTNEIIITRW